MKKIKILTLGIMGFLLLPILANASTAFVASCNYGFLDINTNTIGDVAFSKLISNSMRYTTTRTTAPSRMVLQGSFNGLPYLESSVLYFAGHGDKTTVTFNGCVSQTSGIGMGQGIASSGHLGIRSYNLNKVNLAVLQACETAKDSTGNITKLFVDLGAKASLGWTSTINTASGEPWAERFWTRITGAYTFGQAVTYANSFTYLFNNIKNTKTYGNTNLQLLSFSGYSLQQPNSFTNKYTPSLNIADRSEYQTSIAITENNVLEKINFLIKNQFNNEFNEEDYILKITNNEDMIIYDLILNVNDVYAELGYTIFVENSIITNIFDNTQNLDINVIKQNILNNSDNLEKNIFMESEMLVYDFNDNKFYKYTEIEDIDTSGAKRYSVKITDFTNK